MLLKLPKTIRKGNFAKNIHVFLWCLSALILTNTFKLKSQAVQYPDGKLAFESAVLLIDTHATFNQVRSRQAKYYFDLELPKDVGEPLGKVIIKQRAGGERVRFELDKTKVYLGNHNNKQEELNSTTTYNEETEEITVKLNRPILPGSNLTVGIKPKRNPDYAGVYLFGVTAFPPGERSLGLYLGAGRIHFYRRNDLNFY